MKRRRSFKEKRWADCPSCGTARAIGNPPAPGDIECLKCGYDPCHDLTEQGWRDARDLYRAKRGSKVKVIHPEKVGTEGYIEIKKFDWEDARSFVTSELGESLQLADGQGLASKESILASWDDHDRKVIAAIEYATENWERQDLELLCTLYVPAIEAGDYDKAEEIKGALAKLGTDRRRLLISDDKAERRAGKLITTKMEAGEYAAALATRSEKLPQLAARPHLEIEDKKKGGKDDE